MTKLKEDQFLHAKSQSFGNEIHAPGFFVVLETTHSPAPPPYCSPSPINDNLPFHQHTPFSILKFHPTPPPPTL